MNALLWLLRGFLFVALLGLAIKNSGEIELRFFFDASWHAPLSVTLLVAMVTGVVFGILALLPRLVRQRRDISTLKRQLAAKEKFPAVQTPVTSIDFPPTGF
jgi:lipopolysaccharide assembly protein A